MRFLSIVKNGTTRTIFLLMTYTVDFNKSLIMHIIMFDTWTKFLTNVTLSKQHSMNAYLIQFGNMYVINSSYLSVAPMITLTHWGRVSHICVVKLTIIGSDNGLSPGRRQAIIWTNDGLLLIWPLGTNFSEMLIGIQTFSFKKMHLKMSSAKWRPFCLGLNVLT